MAKKNSASKSATQSQIKPTTTPSETAKTPLQIGIIVGAGTGKRLADIFEEFLRKVVAKHGVAVSFVRDPAPEADPPHYHSYQSLEKMVGKDTELFKKISDSEVERLLETCQKWFEAGVRVVFRTAINAETLYLFRQRVRAVKEFSLNTLHGRRILFVRDQAEGFYANTRYSVDKSAGRIRFEGEFTREHQQQVMKYALRRANEKFGGQPFRKWAIYKHHLFGDVIQEWAEEVDSDFKVYQPDTGLTELHKFFDPPEQKNAPAENLVVVCSNEVGDIVYESIIKDLDPETKLMLFAKNVYLSPPFYGFFADYQTLHGSADDKVLDQIENEEIIPYATYRIAAEIMTTTLSLNFESEESESAIIYSRRTNLTKTISINNSILEYMNLSDPIEH